MRKSSSTPQASAGKLTIGALSRAAGIPVETLRTWESRYGFPVAERKASGHRVYPVAVVPRLRRIAEILARGHRAAEVVPASDTDLDRLAAAVVPAAPGRALIPSESVPVGELLDYVEAFDTDRLTAALLADWGRLTPVEFLRTRIAPLVAGVGDRWAAGSLEIRHEHFLSERVGDVLRSLRLPFDVRATGPRIICATLPGEPHALGLQMAALLLAASGARVTYLGTEIPPHQLAALARELEAEVIAISVSAMSPRATTLGHVAKLRRGLPNGVTILLGGAGAPDARGVVVLRSLDDLDAWSRQLPRPRAAAVGG